ncbi:MAG: glycosyltransferase family A protein [Pseudomonadota bacterium]|nr:glycosyltransferase family A protein [Pseudomonadota bacterium]
MAWSVCIFAHNEEKTLPRAVAALDAAAAGAPYAVHIMENGSTDRTALAARALAAADPRISVHEAALADKTSAWNDYVHRLAPEADMHVFLDADSRPAPGAFRALALALDRSPKAFAAAGLPAAGASRLQWAQHLYTEHYLSGDLYALRGEAVARLRDRALRLPAGAIGEDGILSYLLVTDLVGGEYDGWRERIAVASGAFFEFDPLPLSPRGAAQWRRRRTRAARRRYQHELLFARLKRDGVKSMPDDIREIYTEEAVAKLRPRLAPEHFLFDCLALLEIDPAVREMRRS